MSDRESRAGGGLCLAGRDGLGSSVLAGGLHRDVLKPHHQGQHEGEHHGERHHAEHPDDGHGVGRIEELHAGEEAGGRHGVAGEPGHARDGAADETADEAGDEGALQSQGDAVEGGFGDPVG